MELKQVVIHELVKEQHKDIQKSQIRDRLLPCDNEIVLKLVTGVAGLYGKKNNSAHYGIFNSTEEATYFPAQFDSYQAVSPTTDKAFLTLTEVAMARLKHYAGLNMASSGGYILFANYTNDQGNFFLAAMLKKRPGITLSADLVPKELDEIDLNSLHQAARMNFKRYQDYQNASEVEQQDLSYLSFVSPSTSKSAAGYFVTALGCAKGTTSSKATDTVVKVSGAFFRSKPELKQHSKKFKDDLVRYLNECENDGKSAKLSEVEKIARKYFPADGVVQPDILAEELFSTLNSDENQVPVEFPVNKATLKKHTHLKFTSEKYQILLDRGALGETEDSEIQYNKTEKSLIFRNITIELAQMLEQELKDSQNGS